jgi:hypothetical protein
VKNKEKEDQNVLGNKKNNTYDTPLGKISMVRREIRHYIFVFFIRQSRRFKCPKV